MSLIAAVGLAQVMDAREAGMQAAYQALNKLGTTQPSLALVIVPYRYDPRQVINGASGMLSNVPMIGFSVSSGLTQTGSHPHSVIVALLAGDSLQAETHWFPTFSQSSSEIATRITQLLGYEQRPADQVLVFAEGLNSDADEFCNNLPVGLPILGGLSSGDIINSVSFQFAGMQTGSGGMAAAFLRGDFKIGLGCGHGWHAVGSYFRVTRSVGFWLRRLDGKPATETLSNLFGQTSRAWSLPPLNTMCRMYPLGFEQAYTDELLVRSPIRVEADGSLRMNVALREGSDAYLMVGSPEDCLNAAKKAAQDALAELGGEKPKFALVLVDVSWQTLLQAQPGKEIQVVQEILGADVPIAGGYTLGQIIPPHGNSARSRYLNQHIVVAVFSMAAKTK
jgi:hypothetical protein